MFPTERHQRAAVRALAKVAANCLALFGLVIEHGHIALIAPTLKIKRLKSAIADALGKVASEPVTIPWCERIQEPKHLRSLVRYHVRQSSHHDVPGVHPALWSGSCFQELLRARDLPGLRLRIGELLPDLRLGDLLEMVGLPRRPIDPADDWLVRAAGAMRLTSAAAAALAVGPGLKGRSAAVVAARRVVVQVGAAVGIAKDEIIWALQTTMRSYYRLLDSPQERGHALATRTRIGLEEVVARTTGCITMASAPEPLRG